MHKGLKIALVAVGSLVAVAAGAVGYFAATFPGRFPETPYPEIKASTDPAVIARGEYLFHRVAHCSACHSESHAAYADPAAWAGAGGPTPSGGYVWDFGPFGKIRSANITPHETTGIGAHSDAELARVIRYGVKRDGTVAPFMMAVGPMSDEDLTAVISYVRSLAPVDKKNAPHEITVAGKVFFSTVLAMFWTPLDKGAPPPFVSEGGVSVERGRYLAEGPANCVGCHSKFDGKQLTGRFCGNPDPFPDPEQEGYGSFAPNLTTHPTLGAIMRFDEDGFVLRMRQPRAIPGSPMPWEAYAHMNEDDVRSLHRYLRALEPCDLDVGVTHRKM